MNEDALKLTSYFGERQRTADNGFAADALLDLYGQHAIATSILLRGVEGFGARQHLRTDRSLTMSDDLPLIAVAVDTRPRIEALLESTSGLLRSGLVTLERARLLAGDIEAAAPGEAPDDETKLTVYVGRQERVYRVPAFVAICDLLHRRGIAGATALLGVDGTAHGRRERAAFFSRNAATPMMVIAVGSGQPDRPGAARARRPAPPAAADAGARPHLQAGRGTALPPSVRAHAALPRPTPAQTAAMPLAQKLMVYTSEAALHDGRPIHRAIVRRLRAAGISGATTQRGMWGFHGDHPPHGDRLLQLGRHVPAVTIVIDTPERIQTAFDLIDDLTAEHGLVTCETVPAVRPRRHRARDGRTARRLMNQGAGGTSRRRSADVILRQPDDDAPGSERACGRGVHGTDQLSHRAPPRGRRAWRRGPHWPLRPAAGRASILLRGIEGSGRPQSRVGRSLAHGGGVGADRDRDRYPPRTSRRCSRKPYGWPGPGWSRWGGRACCRAR